MEANNTTVSIFAGYCHPCQLLNASVSQTGVVLASAPPLHGCVRTFVRSASIALISGYLAQHNEMCARPVMVGSLSLLAENRRRHRRIHEIRKSTLFSGYSTWEGEGGEAF